MTLTVIWNDNQMYSQSRDSVLIVFVYLCTPLKGVAGWLFPVPLSIGGAPIIPDQNYNTGADPAF